MGKSISGDHVVLISNNHSDYESSRLTRNGQFGQRDRTDSTIKLVQGHFWKRFSFGRYSGWRFGVAAGFWASLLTLVGNAALLGVGITQRDQSGGIGILQHGTPQQMSKTSILFHVFINIQSTILLSASNYCMQVLTAPTRTEIDIAHKSGHYLDIGVLSMHNLKYIVQRKSILFWLLFVSSMPLHLFYNSVISTVISSREAQITIFSNTSHSKIDSIPEQDLILLSNTEWISSQSTYSDYGNLYLVTDLLMCGVIMDPANDTIRFSEINETKRLALFGHATGTFQFTWDQYDQYKSKLPAFTLPDPITFNRTTDNLASELNLMNDNWIDLQRLQLRVSSAFTTIVNRASKVQLILAFMALVVVCNAGKSAVMGYMLFGSVLQDPLVTGGDAIASFMQRPETRSIGYCISTQDEILRSWTNGVDNVSKPPISRAATSQTWYGSNYRVRKAISRRRGNLFLFNYLVVICLIISALVVAFSSPRQESRWAWGTSSQLIINLGDSNVNARGVLINTWLANLPQVFLSAVYFTFNSMLTLMYSAYEWNNWGAHRKYLRVTKPVGKQRSTHFLQLPYKVAVPMTVYSGFLHWLLSQCFFLRRVEFYDAHENLKSGSLNTCGYSPLSLLTFAICALVGTVVISCMSLKSVEQRIPFGASSSVVISAACHPPPDDVDAHLQYLQWGVVQNRYAMPGEDDIVQHCSFTSETVTCPEVGKRYA